MRSTRESSRKEFMVFISGKTIRNHSLNLQNAYIFSLLNIGLKVERDQSSYMTKLFNRYYRETLKIIV